MALIEAWDDDGRAVTIPEHWVGHPTLGAGFTTTRPAKVVRDCCGGGGEVEELPRSGVGSDTDAWLEYARALGLDVDEHMTRADLMAAVDAAGATASAETTTAGDAPEEE